MESVQSKFVRYDFIAQNKRVNCTWVLNIRQNHYYTEGLSRPKTEAFHDQFYVVVKSAVVKSMVFTIKVVWSWKIAYSRPIFRHVGRQ